MSDNRVLLADLLGGKISKADFKEKAFIRKPIFAMCEASKAEPEPDDLVRPCGIGINETPQPLITYAEFLKSKAHIHMVLPLSQQP